ncbi:MAG: hypothetical protein H0V82_02055 [Candidatus Protochlamydia sp.]|nr:hypothetical protein [Candidatus Protochlamydia sp.]
MLKQSMIVFPKPLNDLLQKVSRSSQIYAQELAKKLARFSQETIEILIKQQTQKVDQINQNIEDSYQSVLDLCKQALRGPHIKLELPMIDVRLAQSKTAFYAPTTAELIKGKAVVRESHGTDLYQVECVVASKNWHKLGDIKGNTINLMDHLEKLLPVEKIKMNREEKIGVVTFQNGMANSWDNFMDSAQLTFNQFTEAPLCIGLYNSTTFQSYPCPIDMHRFGREKVFNYSTVASLGQMMKTLADVLPRINPNLFWVHIAHSEGGLIANAALEVCEGMLFGETRDYLKKNLITSTYGAVKPIADEYTKFAINTYSINDVALIFGKDYIDLDLKEMMKSPEPVKKRYKGKTYSIKVINSKLERFEMLKMPVEMPIKLSLAEFSELTFFEYLGYRENIDNAPWTTKACVDLINDFFYRVKDHGFTEASYTEAFKKDVEDFKDKYKV